MDFSQDEYDIRCEWGLEGIDILSPGSDALVIVDVFSFSTCVDLAVGRGAWIYPYRWKDESAHTFAHEHDAILAAASRRDAHGFSLAPSSMQRLPWGARVVLPSPNGATLTLAAAHNPECIPQVFAGCLRNARPVAEAAHAAGQRVSLIPAGERWRNGGMRPALEDWIGAGAIIHHLPGRRSPEAAAAEALFQQYAADLLGVLTSCGSGKEAVRRGSLRDVELAAELNVSSNAPHLVESAYRALAQ